MCLCFGRAVFFIEMHPSVFASQSLARKTAGPTSPRGTGCCLSDGSFIIFFNLNAGETISHSLQDTGYFQDCSQHVSFFFNLQAMAAAQGLLVTRSSDAQPPPAPAATPAAPTEASPPKAAPHSLGQFVAKESEASGGSEESE